MSLLNRLIITGSPGAGKSSAILALSDIVPQVSNIYQNASPLSAAPEGVESVTLDYGEITLDEDRKLEMYATPGQRRFQFMWNTLSKKAMGLMILLDNRRPNPVSDMNIYLDNFEGLIDPRSIVIGVNYYGVPGGPHLDEYVRAFKDKGWLAPILPIDPRAKDECFYLLSALLMNKMG